MAEPKLFVWQDIGYVAEARPTPGGVVFAAWVTKKVKGNTSEVLFLAPSGRYISERKHASPLVNGVIGREGCVDLLFDSSTFHFCDIKQAMDIGEVINRVRKSLVLV